MLNKRIRRKIVIFLDQSDISRNKKNYLNNFVFLKNFVIFKFDIKFIFVFFTLINFFYALFLLTFLLLCLLEVVTIFCIILVSFIGIITILLIIVLLLPILVIFNFTLDYLLIFSFYSSILNIIGFFCSAIIFVLNYNKFSPYFASSGDLNKNLKFVYNIFKLTNLLQLHNSVNSISNVNLSEHSVNPILGVKKFFYIQNNDINYLINKVMPINMVNFELLNSNNTTL